MGLGSTTKDFNKSLFSSVPRKLFTNYNIDSVLYMFYSDLVRHYSLSFIYEFVICNPIQSLYVLSWFTLVYFIMT